MKTLVPPDWLFLGIKKVDESEEAGMGDCGMERQDWLLQNLGNRLRQLRQGRRLRQSDMTSFGLNEKYYQRLESGQVNPTLLTLYKLARTFEISLSYLLTPVAEA
jgi:DNA-binding XRE family transcriptional regulator